MFDSEYNLMYLAEEKHWWYVGIRSLLLNCIKILLPNKGKILDAGCGTGKNAQVMLGNGFNVYGLDLSEEALAFSKKRQIKNLTKGSILNLPFKNNSFDLIYSIDSITVLNEDETQICLNEFYRCIKGNGYLLLNVAAFQWLYSKHDIACNITRRYTKREIVKLVENTGFKIMKSQYRVFFLFPLIVISRFIDKFSVKKDYSEALVKGDLEKTNWFVNLFFGYLMSLENFLLRYINLPFGSSIFIVAKKAN